VFRAHAGRSARDTLTAWRNDGMLKLRDRFQRAVDEGDLPPDSDPERLERTPVSDPWHRHRS
jgi:hypothetical protein